MPKYDLLTEPWIDCIDAGGRRVSLGISDVFRRARDLRSITDPSPLVVVALHRVLLAVLYRTQDVSDDDAWISLWNNGWDHDAIERYLEQYRAGFDLFSASSPFFQRADLDLGEKRSALSKLAPEFAAGRNKQLFDHSSDITPPAWSPADAARMLLVSHSWSIGGGQSGAGRPNFTTSTMPRGASIIPLGSNLLQTLLLNLVPLNSWDQAPRTFTNDMSEDRAVWERPGEPMTVKRFPYGVADYLTWSSRYIRLLPEPDGNVRWMYLVQGEQFDSFSGSAIVDFMHAYGRDEKRGFYTRGIDAERAAWRDASSLFNTFTPRNEGGSCEALLNLKIARDRNGLDLPEVMPVLVVGIAIPGGQPPPDLWIAETFQIPRALLESKDLLANLERALELARQVNDVLKSAVRFYATEVLKHDNGSADPKEASRLAKSLTRELDYWAALEGAFHAYLSGLTGDETQREAAEAAWRRAVEQAAETAFEASLLSQDRTGRHLRALNTATAAFYSPAKGLRLHFPREVNNVR